MILIAFTAIISFQATTNLSVTHPSLCFTESQILFQDNLFCTLLPNIQSKCSNYCVRLVERKLRGENDALRLAVQLMYKRELSLYRASQNQIQNYHTTTINPNPYTLLCSIQQTNYEHQPQVGSSVFIFYSGLVKPCFYC